MAVSNDDEFVCDAVNLEGLNFTFLKFRPY